MKVISPVFLLIMLLVASALRGETTWVSILPSETDPEIHDFNTPHSICVNREILLENTAEDRHELLLFLPGTNGTGTGPKAFLETAANLGYHCITLMYPDDVAAAQVCRDDPDPNSFKVFREALINGGNSPHLSVRTADCIENRLQKLLIILSKRRAAENWGQFIKGGEIAWDRIAVAGQSQGGGHAALIGVQHRVARVLMFGAPKDYSRARQRPAPWYAETKATPLNRFFAINHRQDHQGCSFPEQIENLRALGLDRVGPIIEVDKESPPYRNARILITNYPGTKVDSRTAHGTALANKNRSIFHSAWIYLLTTQVDHDRN